MTGTPDDADLDLAFQQALGTYRHFLADESGFVTQTSPAFPLRTGVAPGPAERPATTVPRPAPPRVAIALVSAAVIAVALVALLVLVPRVSDAGPAGTWTGQLEPVQPGGPASRQMTVTITCSDQDCTGVQGELTDFRCAYALVRGRTDGDELQATVTSNPGGQSADCLPDGTVSLRWTDNTARLDWYASGSDEPLMRASTLTRQSGGS